MRKTFPWLRELLTRFHASWIVGAKSQEGENPNGGGGEDRPVCFAYAMHTGTSKKHVRFTRRKIICW
jgi:hypothetical protein